MMKTGSLCLGALPDNRCRGLRFHVPGKENPGILRYFGNKCVNQRSAGRLGIDSGKMRLWHHRTQRPCGLSCINQIINNQPACTITRAWRVFQDSQFTLVTAVI